MLKIDQNDHVVVDLQSGSLTCLIQRSIENFFVDYYS